MNELKNKLSERLNYIRSLILNMGGFVEKNISTAYEVLLKKTTDKNLIQEMILREGEINDLQLKVSRVCFKILARQSPVARDLRMILAILSANTDLERMGDLAVNVAQRASSIGKEPIWDEAIGLFKKIFNQVSKMVHKSLDAFVDEDEKLARSILIQDDNVDQIRDRIRALLDETTEREVPKHVIKQCIDLIIIAGELERIADHATNIAEEVIFLKTGDDVRHQGVLETENE